MKRLTDYIGIEPFTVKVDKSPQLRKLTEQARSLRELPFKEKLENLKKLSVNSMINAYEQSIVAENPEPFKEIVYHQHPLSYALQRNAGCCRYQGALFFVLGYEAELGDKHFIQAAPVTSNINSVFNEVINEGKSEIVSIFLESLNDKSLDYSTQNPRVFEQAFRSIHGYNFYSYHKTPEGLIIIENPNRHIQELK